MHTCKCHWMHEISKEIESNSRNLILLNIQMHPHSTHEVDIEQKYCNKYI